MRAIAERYGDTPFYRALTNIRYGAVFWLAFGAVALALRGVRWDEDYEWAQILTGMVEYPEGHPLLRWIGGLATIQLYGTAWLMELTPNPAIVCGVRNLLFIWASVAPVYLLGAALSRNAIVGHAAAAFVLMGVHLEFDGAYPQFVWPGMFSNGHIGTGYALLWLSAAAFGRVRLAAFMLGLMPAVHLGQVVPCLVFAMLWAGWSWRKGNGAWRRALPLFACGALLTVSFMAFQRGYAVPAPTEGTYFSTADARAVWEGSVAHHDMHRSPPGGNSHIAVAGFVLLMGLLWRTGEFRRHEPAGALQVCAAFGLGTIAIVYGIMAVHVVLGKDVPYLFLRWLPYRLVNLIPPMLVALLVTKVAEPREGNRLAWLLPACIGAWLLQPLAPHVVGAAWAARYFAGAEWIGYVLFGAVWGRFGVAANIPLNPPTKGGVGSARGGRLGGVFERARSFMHAWFVGGASVVGFGTLALVHQFGAACVVLGAAIGGATVWWRLRRRTVSLFSFDASEVHAPRRAFWAPIVSAGLCAAVVVSVLRVEHANRAHLPATGFAQTLGRYLAAMNVDQTLLVVPPYQVLMQAQTGQPVTTDLAMTYFIGYRPALGPSIQKMYTELYGIDFTRPLSAGDAPEHWTQVWERRSKEEWRALAAEYGFRLVIAPSDVDLALKPILAGAHDTCYYVGGGFPSGNGEGSPLKVAQEERAR